MSPAPALPRVSDLHDSLAASPVALAIIDGKGRIRDVNDAFAKQVGLGSAGDAIGSSGYRFVTEANQPKARHLVRDLIEGLVEAWSTRGETLRADGAVEPNLTWARRVVTVDGPMLLLGVSAPRNCDPTHLAHPTYADQLAVLITDHDWRVADASSDAEKLLGAAPGQLVGAALLGLLHPLDATSAVPALAHLETEREAITVTLRISAGGEWRNVVLTVSRLCRHSPPRLVCLLAPARAAPPTRPMDAAADPIATILTEVADGDIVSEVAVAALGRAAGMHRLTGRQWEIVARVMRGQSTTEIARSMFLNSGTVRNHLTEIYRQFGVHSQAGLLSRIYAGHAETPTRDV